MNSTVIKVENLSKVYRVGQWGTGTISHDLNRWWKTKIRGEEDPYSKVSSINDHSQIAQKGELVKALNNINFDVKQGEVLGIIGKNGAGKSTLLKILSRITAPTTGSAKIKGRVASLLEVGTGFHPEMTGRENIYMNGTINGMRKYEISQKLDEIVEFAGVAKYIDTPVKRYSSGMKVRLGFAVAAFLEPEILIVDEVLAVGDAEFQKKAIGKMQDVSQNKGRTVLFVSHNMKSVSNLCSKGIILYNGYLKMEGNIDNIIHEYIIENRNSLKSNNFIESIKNPNISIIEFNINHNNGNIFVNEDIYINVIIKLKVDFKNILFTLRISTYDDITLLDSNSLDNENIKSHNENKSLTNIKNLVANKYNISVKIPKYYLNEGDYKLKFYLFGPTVGIYSCLEKSLEIKNIIDSPISHIYKGRRPGILIGNMEWKINEED